jgi:hypothetical protein
MSTQMISIEVDLQDHSTVSTLYQAIHNELLHYGHPLKWIVVDADKASQKAFVKALVEASIK